MNWEEYKNADGSIDLVKAYTEKYGKNADATWYFVHLEALQPIKSRQVAAVVLLYARTTFDRRPL